MARGKRVVYDEAMNEGVKEEMKKNIEKSPAKVRRWPDKDSEVVETLRAGDHVVIYGKRGDFYEVSTSVNHRVYISSEYLKEE